MMTAQKDMVLQEAIWNATGAALWVKRAILVLAGIAILTLAAKIRVPLPPSPVPVTMGTFAVLTLAVAYGPRLGLVTMLGYLLVGAAGFDVFANSSSQSNGLSYMMGTTGGYLGGYLLATIFLGWTARMGWDRSVLLMVAGLFVANVIIYGLGVPWLHHTILENGMYNTDKFSSAIAQTMQWGFTPYIIGDAIKLALAALLIPAVWKLVGKARA